MIEDRSAVEELADALIRVIEERAAQNRNCPERKARICAGLSLIQRAESKAHIAARKKKALDLINARAAEKLRIERKQSRHSFIFGISRSFKKLAFNLFNFLPRTSNG